MVTPPTRPPRTPARTICLGSARAIASLDVSVVMTMPPPLQLQPRSTGCFGTRADDVGGVRCLPSWSSLRFWSAPRHHAATATADQVLLLAARRRLPAPAVRSRFPRLNHRPRRATDGKPVQA